ncbi:MAG: ferritin family protein [Candidatus Omnitrophota bacterium]
MANIFSGSEIVELGIQIENNGRDFYNALAGKSKNPKAQSIFAFLAQEEGKHIFAFQKILDSVEKYQPPEAYPGEYFAYMKTLADKYIFTKKDEGRRIAEIVKSDAQALDMGIGFEKDSIDFYQNIKKVVPAYGQKIVDGVVAQEQKHLEMLSDLRGKA